MCFENSFYINFFLFFFIIGLPASAQFSLLDSKETGIKFKNNLSESEEKNILSYEYFYNGGGVAVGDLNNDGLPDLYFTGNMVRDRIYINEGSLRFKDITRKSGIVKNSGWKTGVSLVDINEDGWLDIYVCYSGNNEENYRRNKLYINNKDLTFTEKAAKYGLDLATYSTQAVFFDYDKDGDLDCYLLNHNIKNFSRFNAEVIKVMRDELAGDLLLRNDDGNFVDVSASAGIKGNPIGFGLGVSVADVDHDGWPDILVSNDYIEQDYLYINNRDGTFTDRSEQSFGHISFFSMGNEIADINNDGLPDILTLDMLPEDNRRQKLLYGPENYEVYQNMLKNGFNHQLMRNMFHLNNGNGTFSEIGQLLGVSNTDWSWAPLIADFDNDGLKDLFITNGYLRDYTNMDFMKFYADKELKKTNGSPSALLDIIKEMPSTATKNYIFRNEGGLKFENKVEEWGMSETLLSNGAVYADLDQDGDLEIIINNVNSKAAIYRNDHGANSHHFLKVRLGDSFPSIAIGTKVWVYSQGNVQYQEFNPSRGYQSSMYTSLHFGLGFNNADSLKVTWADNTSETIYNLPINNEIVLNPEGRKKNYSEKNENNGTEYFSEVNSSIPYKHIEDVANDFKSQPLMPNMLSYQGPHIASGDVNGDGLLDLYVPGAHGQEGTILLQQNNGVWKVSPQEDFKKDLSYEDTDAIFFDADRDGDLDLYVVSGGFMKEKELLQDRLYINDGGNFYRNFKGIPTLFLSGSNVTLFDLNNDGYSDLFIGGRVNPGNYPELANSHVLLNDGTGKFTDVTAKQAKFLKDFGLVTDAAVLDLNKDGWQDLIVVGEWMPIILLKNINGILKKEILKTTKEFGTTGWWSSIAVDDLNNDGYDDIIVGNFGWNNQLKPAEEEPVQVFYDDFDLNGSLDPFITYFIQGRSYPFESRDGALAQLFSLRKKFPNYESYAEATIDEILFPRKKENFKRLKAETFSSVVLENKKDNSFIWHELPPEAQFAPVYAIATMDINRDGLKDLILAGNQTHTRIQIGKMDANYGMLFKNLGSFSFSYVPQYMSGLNSKGDTRDLIQLKKGGKSHLLFARNNDTFIEYIFNDVDNPGNSDNVLITD